MDTAEIGRVVKKPANVMIRMDAKTERRENRNLKKNDSCDLSAEEVIESLAGKSKREGKFDGAQ